MPRTLWFWIGIPLVLLAVVAIIWLLRDRRKVGYLRIDQQTKYCERPLTVHGWQEVKRGEFAQLHLNDGTKGVIIGPARLCVTRFKWSHDRCDGDVHLKMTKGTLLMQTAEKARKINQRIVELPQFTADIRKGRVGLHITRRKCGENLVVSLLDECNRAGQVCIRDECRDLRWNLQAYRTNGQHHCSIPFMYPKEVRSIFGQCDAIKTINYLMGARPHHQPTAPCSDDVSKRPHRHKRRRRRRRRHRRSLTLDAADDADDADDAAYVIDADGAIDVEDVIDADGAIDVEGVIDAENDVRYANVDDAQITPTDTTTSTIADTKILIAPRIVHAPAHVSHQLVRRGDAVQLNSERGYCALNTGAKDNTVGILGNGSAIDAMVLIVTGVADDNSRTLPSTFRLLSALASSSGIGVDSVTGKLVMVDASNAAEWQGSLSLVDYSATPLHLFTPTCFKHIDSGMFLTVAGGALALASRRTYPFTLELLDMTQRDGGPRLRAMRQAFAA
jgi:hypothetical protein